MYDKKIFRISRTHSLQILYRKYNIDAWGYRRFRRTTSRIASKAPLYLRNWKEVVGWKGNFWNYVRGIGNNKSWLGRVRQSRPSIISEGTWGQGRERDVKAHSWSQDARPHEWDTYRRIVQRLKLSSEERKFIMSYRLEFLHLHSTTVGRNYSLTFVYYLMYSLVRRKMSALYGEIWIHLV